MNRLAVYLNEQHVGWLDETEAFVRFTYLPHHVQAKGAALSYSLPVRTEPYEGAETEQYFSNLLPDDYVRTRIGEILKIPRENTFALLAAIGGDCAGAISFFPEGTAPETVRPSYRALADSESAQIISNLERRPLDVGEDGFRVSGAGAQDKLVACLKDGHVLLPLNGTPSTHILKPDIRNYPNSTLNEWYAMKLGERCGLNMASCDIVTLQGVRCYVTERYDREFVDGRVRRLHQEDFCQLLKVDPKRKYESVGGPGLVECFGLLREVGLSATDTLELLRRVVFNFLVGNGDAHGKNLSLLYRAGKSELAPMYDVMCTTVYPEVSKRMAMKIDGTYDFKWITRGKFLRFGSRVGIGEKLMIRTIDALVKRIRKAAPAMSAWCAKRHPSGIYGEIAEGIERRCRQIERLEA